VIRCFHNKQAEKNVIPAVASLNEVLQLLEEVAEDVPQDTLKHKMLVSALDQHLEMQRSNYLGQVNSLAQQPPIMDLAALSDAGIPLKSTAAQMLNAPERRRLLGALLEADGWGWHHVYRRD
jgi:hypothetical protein